MKAHTVKTSRMAYIDNLRALMIIFVVMVHTGVTYSGIGSWYYVEKRDIDLASTFVLGMFQSLTQAYFMALLFLIGGYFTPGSLDKKGAGRFLSDRLFRLGVPTLVYMFLLHPVCVKLAYPNVNIGEYYLHGIMSFGFVSWSGPLWFTLTLLLFSGGYVLFRKIRRNVQTPKTWTVTTQNVLRLVALIAVLAFTIRLVFPIGTAVINLQFCFFSAYIVMFAMGIRGYRDGWFEHIEYAAGTRWFILAFVIGLPCWVLLILFGGPLQGVFLINGGFNWQAAMYALWESFFCVTISLGLIGIFSHRVNSQNALQKFLSDNAFGVYVFHAPILIGISVAMKSVMVYPLIKFAIVSIMAVTASFSFAFLIRKVKGVRKIFS